MRKLFKIIFIFFILSLFSLRYPLILILLPLPLILIKRKDFLIYYLLFVSLSLIRISFTKPIRFEKINEKNIIGKVYSIENENSLLLKTKEGKKYLIYKKGYYNLKPYDEIKVDGEFLDDLKGNPGEETYLLFLLSKGIRGSFYANSISLIKIDNSFISKVREKIYKNIKKLGQVGEIVEGLFLGGETVEKDIKDFFKYSGTLHLLAISGLHISLISTFFSFFINPFIVVFVMFIYLNLILFPVSALRAFIMISFYIISKSFYREVDSLNLILFVAMMLILFNPYNIVSPSFLLTFISTIIIITIVEKIKNSYYKIIISPTLVSSLNFPILIYFFSFFSYVSFISNILLIPLVTIFIPFIFFFVILSLFFDNLILILKPISTIFYEIVKFFSNLPFNSVGIKKPSIIFLILFLIIFFFVIFIIHSDIKIRKFKFLIIVFLIFTIISFSFSYVDDFGKLKIIFFDVGEGDSILIKTPYNKYILIDGGGTNYKEKNSPGIRVLNSLKRLGINKIDLLIFTHEDNDHIEGIFHIIDKEKVINLAYPDILLTKLGKDLLNLSEKNKIIRIKLKRDDKFEIDGIKFLVLNPYPNGKNYLRANDNNNSLCLLIEYKEYSILLTGDIEKEALEEIYFLYSNLLKDITILKLPHHGSKNSFNKDIFSFLNPTYSIISVGENYFGHPSSEIITFLDSLRSKILRTDENGAVEFEFYENKLKYKTYDFSAITINLFENRLRFSLSYPP